MTESKSMPKLRPTIYVPLGTVPDAERSQDHPPVSGTRTDSSPEHGRLAGGTLGPSFLKGAGCLNWV